MERRDTTLLCTNTASFSDRGRPPRIAYDDQDRRQALGRSIPPGREHHRIHSPVAAMLPYAAAPAGRSLASAGPTFPGNASTGQLVDVCIRLGADQMDGVKARVRLAGHQRHEQRVFWGLSNQLPHIGDVIQVSAPGSRGSGPGNVHESPDLPRRGRYHISSLRQRSRMHRSRECESGGLVTTVPESQCTYTRVTESPQNTPARANVPNARRGSMHND